MSHQTSLILSDVHLPFESPIWASVKQFIKNHIFDEIILNGDFIDSYSLSKFPKHPEMVQTIMDECSLAKTEIQSISEYAKKIIYLEGNHENRYSRWVIENCRLIYSVIPTLPELLGQKEVGFDWIPYCPEQGYEILGTDIICRHEPLGGGKNCASSTMSNGHEKVIFGHTHRIQLFEDKTLRNREIFSISGGWLGDKNNHVFYYDKSNLKWQLGFVLIHKINKTVFYEIVRIIDDKFLAMGRIYEKNSETVL